MIDKYYNGVIELVYNRVGQTENNIVMVSYSNDFSIRHMESIRRYSRNEGNVFFAWHDFEYGVLEGAYEPFLDTICDMYRTYVNGDFAEFLDECGVYELHKSVLLSYYKTGVCKRDESILLNEVAYERRRMTQAVSNMLKQLSELHPVVMVVNRFQRASRSTLEVVDELMIHSSANIGLVLGVNAGQLRQDSAAAVWDKIVERLEDNSNVYHIGSSGQKRTEATEGARFNENFTEWITKIRNIYELLDFEQVRMYCQQVEEGIKFEDVYISDEQKLEIYLLYAHTSILLEELSKALELVSEISRLKLPNRERIINSECAYLLATCNMYQGKLENAKTYANMALEEAKAHGDEFQVFKAELLMVQAQMSGWYNIYFCVKDIPIDNAFMEKLVKYNYRNHLAHIYIYAYDNSPEAVEKAADCESALPYFSKGVALAKELDNEELVHDAYQKNLMIASTNGMSRIAIYYILRTYQFTRGHQNQHNVHMLCSMGYSLSAMGDNVRAEAFYNRAIERFYELRLPEDIAEVYYNLALNNIMQERYAKAEQNLQMTMKVISNLHMNSLRVCNLSKLYGLLALSCILQKDRFNCERYLLSCRQFLNYIIEKEKENASKEIIHDYAQCDDDMFLYSFSEGLLHMMDREDEKAFESMEQAEQFLRNAEGNQFFAYRIFRESRMKLFRRMGCMDLYQQEKELLEDRERQDQAVTISVPDELLSEMDVEEVGVDCRVAEEDIEALIKQEAVARDYQLVREQMDFISTWQNLIDINNRDITELVRNAIHAFSNHFGLDRSLYVRYHHQKPTVLYNDALGNVSDEDLEGIKRGMREYPQGFAVSKIKESFSEHQDVISYFGMDDVCSFVAIPFVKNGEMTSLLITYVQMKDNWHGSIERYMLGEDDLPIYRLLFRDLEQAINRLEANKKIREMNSKLQAAAVTDALTGIYNRAGMYEALRNLEFEIQQNGCPREAGLMFIDLDNFKHYNDTYGHDVGDLILKEMAQIFVEVSKGRGFVSRYGGDEFIIIVNTSDKVALEELAKEIYRKIGNANGFQGQIENYLGHEVEMDSKRLITCSIGIAADSKVQNEEDFNKMIRRADDRMYSVKTGTKGHYSFI